MNQLERMNQRDKELSTGIQLVPVREFNRIVIQRMKLLVTL